MTSAAFTSHFAIARILVVHANIFFESIMFLPQVSVLLVFCHGLFSTLSKWVPYLPALLWPIEYWRRFVGVQGGTPIQAGLAVTHSTFCLRHNRYCSPVCVDKQSLCCNIVDWS